MARICHAHCPDESGAVLAVLAACAAVLLVLGAALAFMADYGSLVVAAGFVLLGLATAAGVVVVRRDRPRPAIAAPAVPALALAARRSPAIPAPAARAIEGRPVIWPRAAQPMAARQPREDTHE